MISILICSLNASYLENLKINIRDTIGTEYELLVWDNFANRKPIAEVYNRLAEQAKYPYYCFIHEDIQFQTKNWSANLLDAFEKNKETGLIGIAGSAYKSRAPSGWSTGLPDLDYCNIFHQDKHGRTEHLYNNPGKSLFENVVNIDGVFIAIRKEVWKSAKFNEKLLYGFHLYDIDFSFHVIKKWKAAVIFDIDILHFTEGGNFGNEWVEYTVKWHTYFSDELPQTVDGFARRDRTEIKIVKNWLYRLQGEEISWRNKWKWVIAGKSWYNPLVWPYIGIFLFGKYFKKGQKSAS
jgi:hypothetical protein